MLSCSWVNRRKKTASRVSFLSAPPPAGAPAPRAGADRGPSPQFLCTVIAIVLHYVYLSTFAWTSVESLHVHRMLTEVRNIDAGPMRFYYVVGWGFPAIVTGEDARSSPAGRPGPRALASGCGRESFLASCVPCRGGRLHPHLSTRVLTQRPPRDTPPVRCGPFKSWAQIRSGFSLWHLPDRTPMSAHFVGRRVNDGERSGWTDRRMNEWMNGWAGGWRICRRMGQKTDGWTSGRMDGRMEERVRGWVDG